MMEMRRFGDRFLGQGLIGGVNLYDLGMVMRGSWVSGGEDEAAMEDSVRRRRRWRLEEKGCRRVSMVAVFRGL